MVEIHSRDEWSPQGRVALPLEIGSLVVHFHSKSKQMVTTRKVYGRTMRFNTFGRSLLSSLAVVALALGVPLPGVSEVVSTSEALALETGDARKVVDAYLAREEVAAELAVLGVDPEVARLRAKALSGEELEGLVTRIEQAPAGGDGVVTVLGVTFLVLLILELVGVIDIFKKF
jgi:hypothetical protein